MKLKDKVAIVTGSGRGIGRAVALRFAEQGACVVVNYVQSVESGKQVVEEIIRQGGKAIGVRADVSREEGRKHLLDETLKEFKQIDILVNNAGLERGGSINDVTEEDWLRVAEVNIMAPFFLSREAFKIMEKQQKGKIINVTSTTGFLPNASNIVYRVSKSALIHLTKCLALAFAPHVQVNGIAPGMMEHPMKGSGFTPEEREARAQMRPLKRLGTLSEIADLFVYLASDQSNYITGEIINFDGGFVIAS
jgi:3-oxoacyl-[acyl-carrier protein] reductase